MFCEKMSKLMNLNESIAYLYKCVFLNAMNLTVLREELFGS